MWTTAPPLNLLRYLVVLRVKSTLVRLPPFPAVEFSRTLGEIICERLPTPEAKLWRKALNPWQEYVDEGQSEGMEEIKKHKAHARSTTVPDVAWPFDVILHVYASKQIFGQGELILCEIKLLGENAEHGLFLEHLLPALETASVTTDRRWNQATRLWGHFEIDSIAVAYGPRWQPLVQQGSIDLTIRPTARQWVEGLAFNPPDRQRFTRLVWLTPFALGNISTQTPTGTQQHPKQQRKQKGLIPPALSTILAATATRIETYLPGWLASLRRPSWGEVLQPAQSVTVRQNDLHLPPKQVPGQAIGLQSFSSIPPSAVPYLALGSILHIGQYTHFGCGTFVLER